MASCTAAMSIPSGDVIEVVSPWTLRDQITVNVTKIHFLPFMLSPMPSSRFPDRARRRRIRVDVCFEYDGPSVTAVDEWNRFSEVQ
jgi:hypothetical protein